MKARDGSGGGYEPIDEVGDGFMTHILAYYTLTFLQTVALARNSRKKSIPEFLSQGHTQSCLVQKN